MKDAEPKKQAQYQAPQDVHLTETLRNIILETQGASPIMQKGSGANNTSKNPNAKPSKVVVYGISNHSFASFGDNNAREGGLLATIAECQRDFPLVWVDVEGLGSVDIIDQLANHFDIHTLILEDIYHLHRQRAKFEQYGDKWFFVTYMIEANKHLRWEQLSIFGGKGFLLTFQEGPLDATADIVARLEHGQGRMRTESSGYLAYAIVDSVIDGYYPVLEYFGDRLENLEEEIMERPSRKVVPRIHRIKRELLIFRRVLFPMREAINSIFRLTPDNFDQNTLIHLRDCQDHVVQITDFLETYRELSSDLMDVYLSSISYRLNETMKVLTIITTICAPPTLIAGVYGMNFRTDVSPWNMPELTWPYGYVFALMLMVITSSLTALFVLRPSMDKSNNLGAKLHDHAE